MDAYIIAVDQNGQAYIEHAWNKKSHKYIAKIGTGPTARYFYTREEWNAYLKNKNRPKSQAERENEQREDEKVLREASNSLKNSNSLLEWSKKMRDQNDRLTKQFEDEYKQILKKAAVDPNYSISKTKKWMYEDAIKDGRKTAKEWNEWIKDGEYVQRKDKKVFSDALRKVNQYKK